MCTASCLPQYVVWALLSYLPLLQLPNAGPSWRHIQRPWLLCQQYCTRQEQPCDTQCLCRRYHICCCCCCYLLCIHITAVAAIRSWHCWVTGVLPVMPTRTLHVCGAANNERDRGCRGSDNPDNCSNNHSVLHTVHCHRCIGKHRYPSCPLRECV